MQKFIVKIEDENYGHIQDNRLECYILTSALAPEFIRNFAAQAVEKNKIVLIEGENAAGLCREYDLDGIVLDLSCSEKIKAEIKTARAVVGKNKFLGVICRNRRHEAMVASEEEPDFLSFRAWNDGIENVRDLVSWYSELFLIQSAVACMDENLDFASFKSDIVILNDKEYKILVAKNESLD